MILWNEREYLQDDFEVWADKMEAQALEYERIRMEEMEEEDDYGSEQWFIDIQRNKKFNY